MDVTEHDESFNAPFLKEVAMEKTKKKWVRVQMDQELHQRVRQEALRKGTNWDTIAEEAMQLWLSQQEKAA